ncbi:phosphoesterase [Oenococcus alcoholitolerans]|uniref:phosphoesterase n=1 Tax=Oenococcus alcoholitolerans TaxID=931074 RepID=UPI003F6FA52E
MAIRLNYFIFYIGNISYGFDYIYTKRHNGHAFYLRRPPLSEIANVQSEKFDFYNPHYSSENHTPFTWKYDEKFTDLTRVWDHFSEVVLAFIEDWADDYRAPVDLDSDKNVEWGIRFNSPKFVDEQFIFGVNAFPPRFDDFVNYIRSFDPEAPTKVPDNLPSTKGRFEK